MIKTCSSRIYLLLINQRICCEWWNTHIRFLYICNTATTGYKEQTYIKSFSHHTCKLEELIQKSGQLQAEVQFTTEAVTTTYLPPHPEWLCWSPPRGKDSQVKTTTYLCLKIYLHILYMTSQFSTEHSEYNLPFRPEDDDYLLAQHDLHAYHNPALWLSCAQSFNTVNKTYMRLSPGYWFSPI
jgi:hypothetical protein